MKKKNKYIEQTLLMQRKQELLGKAIRYGLDVKKYANWLGLKMVTFPLEDNPYKKL